MAIKTFTTGEVLTAADTNTYLANSGLVYIKQQTIGSGVASQTVTGAFSSTYDNYKIVVAGGACTSRQPIDMQLGATTTGYYWALTYVTFSTGVLTGAGVAGGASHIRFVGQASASGIICNFEIQSPNLATNTMAYSAYYDLTNGGNMVGFIDNTTQYTDFTLSPTSGTLTGGTITVYGYRKG